MSRTTKPSLSRDRVTARTRKEVSGVRAQPAPLDDGAPAWTKTDTFRPPAAGHVDYVQLPKRRRS